MENDHDDFIVVLHFNVLKCHFVILLWPNIVSAQQKRQHLSNKCNKLSIQFTVDFFVCLFVCWFNVGFSLYKKDFRSLPSDSHKMCVTVIPINLLWKWKSLVLSHMDSGQFVLSLSACIPVLFAYAAPKNERKVAYGKNVWFASDIQPKVTVIR